MLIPPLHGRTTNALPGVGRTEGSVRAGIRAVLMIVASALALVVMVPSAMAVDGPRNFPNSTIADHAETRSNDAPAGQCLAFVSDVINEAGIRYWFGNYTETYQDQWATRAARIGSIGEARRGDVIQWGGGAGGTLLHTAIVTSAGGDPGVIDSNFSLNERVGRGTFSSRNLRGSSYRIWRVGRDDSGPPPYQWEYQGQGMFTDSSKGTPTTSVEVGQTAWLEVRARNTGTATWTRDGGNPVHLGTSHDQDRLSAFAVTGSWLVANRPAALKEASVAPGGTGTFEFPIRAPAQPGQYNEYFQPVAEGLAWMNDIGLYWPINVTAPPAYRWAFLGQGMFTDASKSTAATAVATGGTAWLELQMKNTGSATWLRDGANPMRLGAVNPGTRMSVFYVPGTWIAANRAAALKQTSVPPGGTGTFEFPIRAPAQVGVYKEYFQPVAELLSWFNDLGQHWIISVVPPPPAVRPADTAVPVTPIVAPTINVAVPTNAGTASPAVAVSGGSAVAPSVYCRVPKLKGLDLAHARAKLSAAHCRLGGVVRRTGVGGKRGTVVGASAQAGTIRAAGFRLSIALRA